MARILFATQPLTGHVTPFLPVARRLRERGHALRWYTGRRFRCAVEATGAALAPPSLALDFDDRDLDAHLPGVAAQRGLAGMSDAMRRLFVEPGPGQGRDLGRLLDAWPADAVVLDPTLLGATLFAPRPMPPRVGLNVFPLGITSRDTPPFGPGLRPATTPAGRIRDALLRRIVPDRAFAPVQRRVNVLRAGLALPPLDRFFFEAAFAHCDALLQATVPGFEYPRSDLPAWVHFIGPLPPEPSRDFEPPGWWGQLEAGRPVVLVTQGTFATDPGQLLLPTMRALARDDVLVVATGGCHTSKLRGAGLPANARVEPFVPFDRLLPHVDLMVTNGGYGGVQCALRHGVPLVVAGRSEEKAETAARVRWSGAGIDLRTSAPRPFALRRAVRRGLVDPRFAERARELRDEMARRDAVAEATAHVEALLDRSEVPRSPSALGFRS